MAADSDGQNSLTTTVVTCVGDLLDPEFPKQFDKILLKLKGILGEEELLKVCKLEPWNSVRVTLSIPKEAALRLRQLASDGSQQLRALGILSVQVEGDQVISLRLADSSSSEPQEIILRTAQDATPSTNNTEVSNTFTEISNTQSTSASLPSENVKFRSPNVVCPTDTIVPKVPIANTSTKVITSSTKTYTGLFPFTSMNQAMHSRENIANNFTAPTPPPPPPPPPYPGKQASVNISSPLLVNLLQNDGVPTSKISNNNNNDNSETTSSSSTTPSGSSLSAKFNPPPPPPLQNHQQQQQHSSTLSQSQNIYMQKTINNIARTRLIGEAATSLQHHHHQQTVQTLSTNININNNNGDALLNTQIKHLNTLHANNNANNVNSVCPSPQIVSNASQCKPANLNVQTKMLVTSNAVVNSSSNNNPVQARLTNIVNMHTNNSLSNTLNNNNNKSIITPENTSSKLNYILSSSAPNLSTKTAVPYRPNNNPPPPYQSCQWDSNRFVQNTPPLQEITPTLTDLKADDLDHLLPSLEQDLVNSPPDLPELLTNNKGDHHHHQQHQHHQHHHHHKKFLINPLTGELEPQSSSESETEEINDVFTDLPSPPAMSDEDTNSTTRPDTTDQSDSETRSSSHSDSGKHKVKSLKNREQKGRDSPNMKPTEKIKLRLKLEKSEPVNQAYKVDVSFVNTKKLQNPSGLELRVPPLHISLRGRNAIINNKKKIKMNSDDGNSLKSKSKKLQDGSKSRKNDIADGNLSHQAIVNSTETDSIRLLLQEPTSKLGVNDKKLKKIKNCDYKDKSLSDVEKNNESGGKHKSILTAESHYKDKLKERRGSDSELANSTMQIWYTDCMNSAAQADKKRRLSQTDERNSDMQPAVLGSTNTGTVSTINNHKNRKEKLKIKDNFKSKDLSSRYKTFPKIEKPSKQVVLPTGEIDMEAKFKQRLMEEPDACHQISNRTDNNMQPEKNSKVDELIQTLSDTRAVKDKPPEADKCNTPDRKSDLSDKQVTRSPNSGAQGEDSGIESMDALSEKSPNQASQSPHDEVQDTLKSKTQVPDILDIEAQLAKMEGLNGEDLNESNHNNKEDNIEKCCELTSVLQNSMNDTGETINADEKTELNENISRLDLMTIKNNKPENLEPLPVRVTPPLYTYSNPEKARSTSPSLSDSDSNPSTTSTTKKSLLEQLLIEIPQDSHNTDSPSPATRSLRTRATAKLNSPELNSPVQSKVNVNRTTFTAKRKRRESESSNNSLEDVRNKKSKKDAPATENALDFMKTIPTLDPSKGTNIKKKVLDESSDSDEPLIEIAGKVRKNNQVNTPKTKLKTSTNNTNASPIVKPGTINTRRSVRAIPALNTRSKGEKVNPENDVLRRKTRSAVSEGEGKRRKDVK